MRTRGEIKVTGRDFFVLYFKTRSLFELRSKTLKSALSMAGRGKRMHK